MDVLTDTAQMLRPLFSVRISGKLGSKLAANKMTANRPYVLIEPNLSKSPECTGCRLCRQCESVIDSVVNGRVMRGQVCRRDLVSRFDLDELLSHGIERPVAE